MKRSLDTNAALKRTRRLRSREIRRPREARVIRKRRSPKNFYEKKRSLASVVFRVFRLPFYALIFFGAGVALWRFVPPFFRSTPQSTIRFVDVPAAKLELPWFKDSSRLSVCHSVKRGETLGVILGKFGFPWEEAQSIHQTLKELEEKEKVETGIRPGQQLRFLLDDQGTLVELRTKVSSDAEVRVIRSAEGIFTAKLLAVPKEQKDRVGLGVISSSFAAAASRAGIPYNVVDDLVDLLANQISFHRDFRKNDRFTVIYRDQLSADGASHDSGPILAASLETGGKEHIAVRYVGSDGKARYFDEEAELIDNAFLRYPARFSRISSPFSKSRFHPVLKRRRPHNGVDFAAPTGTPVRTVADGRVVFAGRKGPSGIMVKIQHSDRYMTAYLHLSRIAKGVRRGQSVRRGQVIGAVGSTGRSTGSHLHYSFYDRGRYVNPLKIKLPKMESLTKDTRVDKAYLKRVLYTLHHYQTIPLENFDWK